MAHVITDLKCLNMRLNIRFVFVEMVAIEGADVVQLWNVFEYLILSGFEPMVRRSPFRKTCNPDWLKQSLMAAIMRSMARSRATVDLFNITWVRSLTSSYFRNL